MQVYILIKTGTGTNTNSPSHNWSTSITITPRITPRTDPPNNQPISVRVRTRTPTTTRHRRDLNQAMLTPRANPYHARQFTTALMVPRISTLIVFPHQILHRSQMTHMHPRPMGGGRGLRSRCINFPFPALFLATPTDTISLRNQKPRVS